MSLETVVSVSRSCPFFLLLVIFFANLCGGTHIRASVCIVLFHLSRSSCQLRTTIPLSFISWRPNAVQAKQSRFLHLIDMLLPSNLLPASIQFDPLGSRHFLLIMITCAHDRHTVMVTAEGGPRPLRRCPLVDYPKVNC